MFYPCSSVFICGHARSFRVPHCAAMLPEHLVMTAQQMAKIDRIKAIETKRRRESRRVPEFDPECLEGMDPPDFT